MDYDEDGDAVKYSTLRMILNSVGRCLRRSNDGARSLEELRSFVLTAKGNVESVCAYESVMHFLAK